MKREKRLTKREKKEQSGGAGGGHQHAGHIHCIACGRHIDPNEFAAVPPSATVITCQHKSQFPACTNCEVTARYLVEEHDRTNKPVNSAAAYH
jgi:RNA polymerase-binding transcription factor DksA